MVGGAVSKWRPHLGRACRCVQRAAVLLDAKKAAGEWSTGSLMPKLREGDLHLLSAEVWRASSERGS